MTSSTNSFSKDISQITTYQSGIAQSSAHRAINRIVSDYLLQHDLTPMQWFTIGCVYDAGEQGIRLSDLTRKLSTTLPYVTNTITLLESKGMVRKIAHAGDSRIKLASITTSYLPMVEEIEAGLRDHMRRNLYENDHISRDELQAYVSVLFKIVQHTNQ